MCSVQIIHVMKFLQIRMIIHETGLNDILIIHANLQAYLQWCQK